MMTDKEIIKALECCSTYGVSCTNCPAYVSSEKSTCREVLKGAVEIINRQKAEIEKCENIIRLADKTIEKQSAEIERLEDLNKCYYTSCQQIAKSNHEIKAEAVKKFLRKQEIELANNTDISAAGYQSVIELNIKILKEWGLNNEQW